ncbi:chondroitin sulfate synthase 3-like [Ptychodera flava]|uniref:chondroitin sulfate synthase 3-like n=1 Tax=Ptychodera flava TaxID=63121 RepID=UPI003969DBAC
MRMVTVKMGSCLPILSGFCLGILISASLILFATPQSKRIQPQAFLQRTETEFSSNAWTNNRNLKNDVSAAAADPKPHGSPDQPNVISFRVAEGRQPKSVPRLASDELSVRKLLYAVVILPDLEISGWSKAIRDTWGQHSEDYALFISTDADSQPDRELPVIRLPDSTDKEETGKLLYSLKHTCYHNIDSYSWFLILPKHNVYVDLESMETFLLQFNNSQVVYMGSPDESETYCQDGAGLIFSRKALQLICPYLEECFQQSKLQGHGDMILGQCVQSHANVHCTQSTQFQGYYYNITNHLDELELAEQSTFQNALSVHPIRDIREMYRIHLHKSEVKLELAEKQSMKLVELVEAMDLLIDAEIDWTETDITNTVGYDGHSADTSRSNDVWEYLARVKFNSGLSQTDVIMGHTSELELSDIISATVTKLEMSTAVVEMDVYRRLNSHSLQHRVTVYHDNGIHHVEFTQPFDRIVALSARTLQAVKINFVVGISENDRHFKNFSHNFEKPSLQRQAVNSSLSVVLFKNDAGGKSSNNAQDSMKFYGHEYPSRMLKGIYLENESYSLFRTLQVIWKEFKPEDLIIFMTTDVSFNQEFLENCQLTAIYGHQVYNPVPFQYFKTATGNDQFDDSLGLWDSANRDIICGYHGDIFTAPAMDRFNNDHDQSMSRFLELVSVEIVRYPDTGVWLPFG